MYVTSHAEDRMSERLNINKKAIKRQAELALERGKKHSDFSGSFCRYLDRVYLTERNANNMRIYNNSVFLFHNDILITVFQVPSKYRKLL